MRYLLIHALLYVEYVTDFILQINLIAPPLFVVTTQTLERTEGLAKLTAAIGRIKGAIEESNGVFNIKMAVCGSCYVVAVPHMPRLSICSRGFNVCASEIIRLK